MSEQITHPATCEILWTNGRLPYCEEHKDNHTEGYRFFGVSPRPIVKLREPTNCTDCIRLTVKE